MESIFVTAPLNKPLHILIIPSEEYLPAYPPLAGVFQSHQIWALHRYGNAVAGVISVRLRYSIPMFIKAILARFISYRPDNELRNLSVGQLLRKMFKKLFWPDASVSFEERQGVGVVRMEGLYFLPPSARFDCISWSHAGQIAFDAYVEKYGKPDLLHAHNAVNAGLLTRKLSRKHAIPYVLTEHSSYYFQGLVPQPLMPGIRKVVEDSSAYLAVSPRLIEVLQATIGEAAVGAKYVSNVLPPLFDDEIYLEREIDFNAPFVFLCVASLVPIKSHRVLLEAFARVTSESGKVHLRLAGDGPLRDELERYAEMLGISHNVHFLGELDGETIRSEMRVADTLVLASKFETFGVVLIEAMAVGLPVVATACGGPEVIVNDTSGLLVQPGSVSALSDGMAWAQEHARHMDKASIMAQAKMRFGGKVFSDTLVAIYQGCLAGKTPDHSMQRITG